MATRKELVMRSVDILGAGSPIGAAVAIQLRNAVESAPPDRDPALTIRETLAFLTNEINRVRAELKAIDA